MFVDGSWFDEFIKPRLGGYSFECSIFVNGDFGDLERIELEGLDKLGAVEFWSKGWVGLDVYDCACDGQIMNVLLSPEEKDSVLQEFERFIGVLMQSG
ncbi:hypothetical protein [Pseudomonas sp. Z3-8]|uniref:hypothetical protein n=1 Tax=Pseudomonas sp. Z3-8 TaxID=2817412 RepID=UPI003DA8EADB